MKQFLLIGWLAATSLCFCGCREFADSISNQTAYPVRVKVTFANGVVNDRFEIWGTNYPAGGIFFQKPVRIESLEAFDSNGRMIGSFSRNAIPHSKEYGRNTAYAVFDDGIFPVANSCWQAGSTFISEDQVKTVFKEESSQ